MQESDTTKLWQNAAKAAEPLMRKALTVPDELLKNLKLQHPNSELLKVAKSTGVLSNTMDPTYWHEIGDVKSQTGLVSAVKHFSQEEVEKFRVSVNSDGKLVDYKGNILECPVGAKEPVYGFVMSTDGTLYVFPQQFGSIHHSSIVGRKCMFRRWSNSN